MRTNQFLTSFSLCAFLLAMAGCTDESQLTSTDAGETDTPVSLTIRTTMTDFAGLPEPDVSSPASTRATNNGNTTTFVPGDKIGIYAVREENGEIFGNIENICLTYEVGSDGITGQWKAPDGVEFYYLPKVMYFAYYPYEEKLSPSAVTLNPDKPEAFGTELAASARFTPKLDQSASGYYARYDLMTAYSRPTTGANPAERVLDLDFRHQHAVFVFIPTTGMFCLPPDGDEDAYTYIGDVRVSVTDTKVTSVNVYDYGWGEVPKPCKMDDGSYRLLISIAKLGSATITPIGTYTTTNDAGESKGIKWLGTPIKNFEAGKSYVLRVANGQSALASQPLKRRVAPGDYVYFDVNWNIIVLPGNCRNVDYSKAMGIVVSSDPARMTDELFIENRWTHACVMPIMPPRDLFEVTWDDYGNERLPDLTTYNDVRNDINGYTSTETMTDGSNGGGSGGYEFLWRLEQIRNYDSQASQYPRISSESYIGKTNCSRWFVPTTGQWRDMITNLGGIPLDKLLDGPSSNNSLNDEEGWVYCGYLAEAAFEKISARLKKIREDAVLPDQPLMFMCCSEADEHHYWSAVIGRGYAGFQKRIKGVNSEEDQKAYFLPFFAF